MSAALPRTRHKAVLVGDSAVGKSSLVIRVTEGTFSETQTPTIGAAFVSHPLAMKDGSKMKLEIWDTAGQERYRSLAPMYYKQSSAGIVVYDVCREASFEQARTWLADLKKCAPSSVFVVLAGNKCDLKALRVISTERGRKFAEEQGIGFIETSAKLNINVDEVFRLVAEKIREIKERKEEEPVEQKDPEAVHEWNLHDKAPRARKAGCCGGLSPPPHDEQPRGADE